MQLSNNAACLYLFVCFTFSKVHILPFSGVPKIPCPFGKEMSQRRRGVERERKIEWRREGSGMSRERERERAHDWVHLA